jgi:RNA 3'-terminal phosphate cyclase (ATP)
MNFLNQHGADLIMTINNRGYYPEGGGQVRLEVQKPSELEPLNPATTENPGTGLFSCSSHLPPHVAERQAESGKKHLGDTGDTVQVHHDTRPGPGTGSSVTMICGWKGSSAIGRRGLPAEKVGEIAAGRLLDELKKPGTIDLHLADQLLVYLAQYGGCFSATDCSLHARTVCSVLARFGYRVRVEQHKGAVFST